MSALFLETEKDDIWIGKWMASRDTEAAAVSILRLFFTAPTSPFTLSRFRLSRMRWIYAAGFKGNLSFPSVC